MNKHSYKVLEFNKLREELANYAHIEENQGAILELEPIKDVTKLRKELDRTRDFMDFLKFDGGIELNGVKDIRTIIKKVQLIGIYLEIDDLWDLGFNLRIFRNFRNRLESLEKYKELTSYFLGTQPLKILEDLINKAINNDKTIKDDASLDLRDIRFQKKGMQETIKRKFDEIFSNPEYTKAIQERIITTRDGRSVIPIKTDFKGVIKGIEHDRSASGSTVFIEPISIVSLNNKMRELEVREREEIRKILLKLTDQVRLNSQAILEIGELIVYLDLLNAKSLYGIEKKATIPEINTKEQLNLISARHPFISEKKVVPLSFEIGRSYNTLLITGPNTGGKTVALKTAGLLTLMTLSGIPIPADEKTSIGFFSGVYADIGDEQSIEQSLSSFSAHLKTIQEILNSVTKSSLILLDELGSGTDPMEGSAFAMAVIDYLKDKKCKSMITTHYSEVKAYGYNEEDIETASMEFDVESLSPTYRLLLGIPGESNALTIAKRLGISDEIIEKAKSYISDEDKKVEKMIINIKERTKEIEEKEEELLELKKKIQKDRDEYEEKLRVLEKEKNQILKDAYEKADKMMKEMQNKAAALVNKIQKEDKTKEDMKEVQKQLNMLRTSLQEEKNENVEVKPKIARKIDYKVGDRVFIQSLNQYAIVNKINMSKETINIQAGILKLEVPMDDVRKVIEPKKKEYRPINTHSKTRVKNEVDLRGKLVDEGIYELENYMDRALMNGYTEIYVIHGKGTGALRAGIIEFLKNSRYVKEFRAGNHNEGGIGCTVVTLK